MTRSTAKYLALLAIAVTLFYWKTLLTNQFTTILGSEGVNLTYGWLHFWVYSVRHGHLPLWDPYAFAGRPFYGEILPSDFLPLQLIFAIFPLGKDGLISPKLYHIVLALTHLLCTYFMFALLRELRCSRFASFIGACAFAMGGLLVRMMWPPYVESCIWLPAIFFFLLRAFRAVSLWRAMIEAALGGLCLGMSILVGGLHFCMMQGIFALAATLFYGACWPSVDRKARWTRVAWILVVFVVISGAAGAVQLLPAYEYSKLTWRFIDGGTFPSSEKIPFNRLNPGMWPQSIVSGLFPLAFGGHFGGGETWPYYIGALPFFLAIAAIWKRWSNLWVRYLTGLAALSFTYSLGEFSPLYGALYALVPFLWVARSPSRFLYLVSFGLAVLAALGSDAVMDRTIARPSWAPGLSILKWIAIACVAALFLPSVFSQISVNIWIFLSLLLILAASGFLAYLIHRPPNPWLMVMLAVFVLCDLGSFDWLEADKSQLNLTHGEVEQMVSLGAPSAFIKAQPGLYRTHVRVAVEPNIGDIYRVPTTWGGGATLLTDYAKLGVREDLLNVRYLIKPASTTDAGAVYQDSHWKIYLNPGAYLRAWVVHKTILEPNHDQVFKHLDYAGLNLHQTALVEAPLHTSLEPNSGSGDSVQFNSYQADRMLMAVNSDVNGLLVLSEIYYPGWQAFVNGKPEKIMRVDGALRGIMIPPGHSQVEVQFVPIPVYLGGALSLLAFLGVLVAALLAWRKGIWGIFDSAQEAESSA